MGRSCISRRALSLASLLLAGCWQSAPPRLAPPKIVAADAAQAALAQYDTNHDGRISGDELDRCPALKNALAELDTDRQRGVTATMINRRIGAWQRSRLGGSPVFCTVRRHGQPLAGAVVRLVPETFLGAELITGSGTTNAQGWVMIGAATPAADRVPGMPPGFYRVEITKPGEAIPARYNTASVLGEEVPNNSKRTGRAAFSYDLDY